MYIYVSSFRVLLSVQMLSLDLVLKSTLKNCQLLFSPDISVLVDRYLQAANAQHTSAFEVLGQLLEKFSARS